MVKRSLCEKDAFEILFHRKIKTYEAGAVQNKGKIFAGSWLHTDMMRLESHGSFAAERTPSEWELAFLEDQVHLSLSEIESRVFEDLHFNSTAIHALGMLKAIH